MGCSVVYASIWKELYMGQDRVVRILRQAVSGGVM